MLIRIRPTDLILHNQRRESTLPEILVNPDRWIIDSYEPEDILKLVDELQEVSGDYEVRPVYQEVPPHWWGGHPVFEVIAVWVPWSHIAAGAASGITAAVTQRTLNWLLERPWIPHPIWPIYPDKPLVKGVHIYGPRGEILQTVEIERPEREPVHDEPSYPDTREGRDPSQLRPWIPEKRDKG